MTEEADDREQMLARFTAKLSPERIRATLGFAGLYQLTHELIKHAVVDEVRQFYLNGFDESGYLYDEVSYAGKVLGRDPKKRQFRASLLWLVENEAITLVQADHLSKIYAHRHDLTHELSKYIVDPDAEPDVQLFSDALEILSKLRRFWTQIEIDTGSFDEYGPVSVDDVVPTSIAFLHMCIEAYIGGLREDEKQ